MSQVPIVNVPCVECHIWTPWDAAEYLQHMHNFKRLHCPHCGTPYETVMERKKRMKELEGMIQLSGVHSIEAEVTKPDEPVTLQELHFYMHPKACDNCGEYMDYLKDKGYWKCPKCGEFR